MGGLGNQMFEYAAGLALAWRRRTVLKLDTTFYHEHDVDDRHYSLDCLNVPAQFSTQQEVSTLKVGLTRQEKIAKVMLEALRLSKLAAVLECKGHAHYQKYWTFYPAFHELPDNTWLYGNFQSEKFFEPVADILRRQFTFRYPATVEVEEMMERIRSKPSVAMHFRRGDYCGQYQSIGALSSEYYNQAINLVRAKVPREAVYYIFSDDIEAVEREFHPPVSHVFVKCIRDANYYDKIRLMSICNHNIIANSTFSWWAAWLNLGQNKLIVAPERWFADGRQDERDMLPAGWIKI